MISKKKSSSHDLQPEHRISCHRCGNIRKRRILCPQSSCPHTFCGRCADKMKDEHGLSAFDNGCPVCKELCCCSNKSLYCHRKNHCYRKCPATKAKGFTAMEKELLHSSMNNSFLTHSLRINNGLDGGSLSLLGSVGLCANSGLSPTGNQAGIFDLLAAVADIGDDKILNTTGSSAAAALPLASGIAGDSMKVVPTDSSADTRSDSPSEKKRKVNNDVPQLKKIGPDFVNANNYLRENLIPFALLDNSYTPGVPFVATGENGRRGESPANNNANEKKLPGIPPLPSFPFLANGIMPNPRNVSMNGSTIAKQDNISSAIANSYNGNSFTTNPNLREDRSKDVKQLSFQLDPTYPNMLSFRQIKSILPIVVPDDNSDDKEGDDDDRETEEVASDSPMNILAYVSSLTVEQRKNNAEI